MKCLFCDNESTEKCELPLCKTHYDMIFKHEKLLKEIGRL